MVFTFPTEPLLFGANGDEQQQQQIVQRRHLGGSGDGEDSYLVDSDGNYYPSYSLAWRYLGLFIDCSYNNNNDRRRRHLEDEANDNNNNFSCQRKLLWAAYHDPGYKGGSIGEYSFYNAGDGTWDGRTCRAQTWWPFSRCKRMNCHEAHTSFELVGVFKETDGFYDWTEQLFKHHGYCLWGGDKNNNQEGSGDGGGGGNSHDENEGSSSDYNFMQNMQEKWIAYCTQLDNTDADGNALYVDTKPLPNGDMTFGLYTDAVCMTESSLTWSDYLASTNNDNNGDGGEGGGEGEGEYSVSTSSIYRWNSLLSDYKVCQPCRAYNRVKTSEGGSHDSEESHDSGEGGEEEGSGEDDDEEWGDEDGEGRKEQWGFNCYDDAGYRNCNQCYKFETQTDMEPASVQDLETASEQGTILSIKVDGTTYGKGHFKAPGHYRHRIKRASILLLSTVVLVGLVYLYYKFVRGRRRGRVGNSDLKEGLTVATHNDEEDGDTGGSKAPKTNVPVVAGIPLTTTTTTPATASTKTATLEKEELVAQIQERDAKLSQQEQLIEQLQRELASYKKKDDSAWSRWARIDS